MQWIKDLLTREQWGQGKGDGKDFGLPPGKLCVVTATNKVVTDPSLAGTGKRYEIYAALLEAAGEPFKTRVDRAVVDWNDRPTTTHEKVMAAFDKAIERAE